MAIKSSQTLVSEALKEIKTISSDEAHQKFNNNQCNLIDIRDIRDFKMREKFKVQIISLEGCLNFG